MEFKTDKPTATALYLVDRGMQGKWYRWYDAKTDQWSLCGANMNEAMDNKDKPSPVGFFPWVGPLTGPNFKANKSVVDVAEDQPVAKPAKKRMAKAPAVVKVKAPKQDKTVHPDGTVFYRADRGKFVCVIEGKQPAARPTKEAVIKWMAKKHPNIKPIILD